MSFGDVDAVVAAGLTKGAGPGAVAVVAGHEGIRHVTVVGSRNPDRDEPMTEDAIFRIASQTKAVNSIAVLQLVEQGLLDLSTPVGDILPDFDRVRVVDGWDGDRPRLRPARSRPTVHHLLTHTSGLTYDALHATARRYLLATGVPMPSSGRLACFESPFVVEPGTQWNYGMSADWTGRVVQEVSGLALPDYYRQRIFEPLGLTDTTFELSDEQRSRLAPVYVRQADGSFADDHFEWVANPEFYSAGHGLYATAADFMTIQLLLMRGGEVDDVRLLKPESVRAMLTDQMGGIPLQVMHSTIPEFSEDLDPGPGTSWGLDILLTVDAQPGLRGKGSAGWAGTFNTFYWIDPQRDVAGALYLQTLPFFDPPALRLSEDFERAVYA